MSKVLFTSTFSLVLLIWASNFSPTLTQEDVPPSQGEAPSIPEFTNDELRQLLEILDEPASKEVVKFDSHPLLHLGELLLDDENDPSPHQPQNEITTTTTPTTTTTTTTTTPPTPPPTTTTTTTLPPPSQISRREDVTSVPQPTHEQLVQQLSLFNSLLMSLAVENVTTPRPDGPPPMTEQQIALLKSLFPNFTPLQTTEPSSTQFLKRQTEPPSESVPQTPSPSSPDIMALSELLTKIAKAPTDSNGQLNLQSITGGGGGAVTSDHLKNFHTNNVNMDPAASNQLSTLLNLLGTLGSLSQAQQQLQQPSGSLFNFGATPSVAPISTNFLSGFLNQNQPQAQASQTSPNIFGNLFNQQLQQPVAHEQQPFNFGNLIAPGIGSALSTMSNIFGGSGAGGKPRVRGKGVDTRLGLGYRFGDAADAQIMWDVGPGLFTEPLQNEPPRYPMTKKKRQDSQPLTPSPPPQHIQAAAQAEKEQQQIAASRRYFQIHNPPQRGQQGQQGYQHRRSFVINPPTTRKPFFSPAGVTNLTPYAQEQALKELWQMMEMKKRLQQITTQKQSSYPPNYFNSLTPAELYQIQRNKHIIKRASTQSVESSHINLEPTNPTVNGNQNVDDFLGSESFLKFRRMPPNSGNNAHYASGFNKKSQQRNQPPQQSNGGGGLFNLNIFGRFRGPPKQPPSGGHPPQRPGSSNNRAPLSQQSEGVMTGSQSQLSRWDMDNHRFDNFKNTNGELVMTDSNSNDRFYLRNRNSNGEFVGA